MRKISFSTKTCWGYITLHHPTPCDFTRKYINPEPIFAASLLSEPLLNLQIGATVPCFVGSFRISPSSSLKQSPRCLFYVLCGKTHNKRKRMRTQTYIKNKPKPLAHRPRPTLPLYCMMYVWYWGFWLPREINAGGVPQSYGPHIFLFSIVPPLPYTSPSS